MGSLPHPGSIKHCLTALFCAAARKKYPKRRVDLGAAGQGAPAAAAKAGAATQEAATHKPVDYSRFDGIDVSDEEDQGRPRMCGCGDPNCQVHVGSKPAIASVESAHEVTRFLMLPHKQHLVWVMVWHA